MPNATALVFLVVLALTPSAAYSHEPAAHGGLIAEVDAHHLELVVGEGELVVYVMAIAFNRIGLMLPEPMTTFGPF